MQLRFIGLRHSLSSLLLVLKYRRLWSWWFWLVQLSMSFRRLHRRIIKLFYFHSTSGTLGTSKNESLEAIHYQSFKHVKLTSKEILTSYRFVMCCMTGGNIYGNRCMKLWMALAPTNYKHHSCGTRNRTTCCRCRRSLWGWLGLSICFRRWRTMSGGECCGTRNKLTTTRRGFVDSSAQFRDTCHTLQSVDSFQPAIINITHTIPSFIMNSHLWFYYLLVVNPRRVHGIIVVVIVIIEIVRSGVEVLGLSLSWRWRAGWCSLSSWHGGCGWRVGSEFVQFSITQEHFLGDSKL